MKFNIFFTLKSTVNTIEVPNESNPVEADSLSLLLDALKDNIPSDGNQLGLETVGLRIENVQ